MSLDQRGETGVPGAQGALQLTEGEIAILKRELVLLVIDAGDSFLDGVVHLANELRGWEEMRKHAVNSRRLDNLKFCLEIARSGNECKAFRNLSSKNRFAVRILESGGEALSVSDAIQRTLLSLPAPIRGRPRSNGRFSVAVQLAHLLRSEGYRPSSTKNGQFVCLLGSLFSIALKEPLEELHNLAEQALTAKVVISPGLMEIPPRP